MLGSVVLYFESKGILDTIVALLKPTGSLYIGVPILLFSVVIPVVKTIVLFSAAINNAHQRGRILEFVHRIGKWSMADVCVVGWLLAYMAAEHQESMKAELQVGILFFASYAVLSIVVSILIQREHREETSARGLMGQ